MHKYDEGTTHTGIDFILLEASKVRCGSATMLHPSLPAHSLQFNSYLSIQFCFFLYIRLSQKRPSRGANHGHATVHHGLNCWPLQGVLQNSPRISRRGINNQQGIPCGHAFAVTQKYLPCPSVTDITSNQRPFIQNLSLCDVAFFNHILTLISSSIHLSLTCYLPNYQLFQFGFVCWGADQPRQAGIACSLCGAGDDFSGSKFTAV